MLKVNKDLCIGCGACQAVCPEVFEIDDDGTPYWICPVKKFTIGLFGGETIGRVVICNAITGDTKDYAIEDCPQWVDRAYPADLLIGQYNYYGEFFMKINSVELAISAVRQSQYPDDKKSEFLILGRSNVGKSSFINTIINRKNLARTSAKPGKTQTLNFYLVNKDFYIVDVPGYGYAATSKKQIEKFGVMI